jgi:methionyl-tRNA synthetase
MWNLYDVKYDKFIRTTDQEHKHAVEVFIKKLQEQGDIYKSSYSGLYCVPCETFVVVNNETPKDEKGEPVCPSCSRELKEVSEESYFFRLSAYQDQLLKFYEENPNFITPKERINEVLAFVKSGLKDLSISRKSVAWGIPFPGDPSHTVYVWGDALTNYISAIGFGRDDAKSQEDFNFWWPADLQSMGKDIVRFHAVYWPAFLMALNLPLPKKLLVHGFILMGDRKMSKSLGNAIDPTQLAEWYGVEQVKYYLMRQISVAQDSQFDLKELENIVSADLANGIGNLLSRTVTLALNNGLTQVKAPKAFEAASSALKEKYEEAFRLYWEEMHNYCPHLALSEAQRFVSSVNAYFHAQQPWVLAKQNKELFEEVIYTACQSMYMISILLWPVLPKKMEALLQALGHQFDLSNKYVDQLRESEWTKTFVLSEVKQALFVRPESHAEPVVAVEEKKEVKTVAATDQELVKIDDFAKVHLIVGTIKTCETVQGSDKLYKLAVDLGKFGVRQILSGVRQLVSADEIVGKQGVVVANLAPRKMMGLESQGMMLFAEDESGNFRLVTVGGAVDNGTRLK